MSEREETIKGKYKREEKKTNNWITDKKKLWDYPSCLPNSLY